MRLTAPLAALLLFQAGGWFLASGILQIQAKTVAHFTMQRRETPLETVTLANSFLSKIRVGKKEIRLEGRLYDIKNQTVKGDSVTLQLYHDKHEEAVLDAVGKLLSPGGSKTAHSLPLQNWLAKWLSSAFLLTLTEPEVWFFTDEFFSPDFHCLPLAAQNAPGCFLPPSDHSSVTRVACAADQQRRRRRGRVMARAEGQAGLHLGGLDARDEVREIHPRRGVLRIHQGVARLERHRQRLVVLLFRGNH